MNLKSLMAKIEKISLSYSKKYDISRDRLWYLLKLQEEVGELTQSYLSMNGQGRKKNKTPQELRNNFENEVADVLCHTLLLAQSEDVNIKKAVEKKWLSQG